jgi:hypothetical protein
MEAGGGVGGRQTVRNLDCNSNVTFVEELCFLLQLYRISET